MTPNRKRFLLLFGGLMVVSALLVGGAMTAAYAYTNLEAVKPAISNVLANVVPNAIAQQQEGETQEEEAEDAPLLVEEEGVLVARVAADSPAAEAGIARGDIILAVDGAEVNGPRELHQAINEHEAGDSITLTVRHGDEMQDISVTLASAGPYLGVGLGGVCAGIGVAPAPFLGEEGFREGIRPFFEREFGREFGPFGERPFHALPFEASRTVTVAEVLPDTPAEAAGLQAGDIITAVDGQPVDEPGNVVRILTDKEPGDSVTLTIDRNGETMDVTVTLGEHPEAEGRPYLGVELTVTIERSWEEVAPEVEPAEPGL